MSMQRTETAKHPCFWPPTMDTSKWSNSYCSQKRTSTLCVVPYSRLPCTPRLRDLTSICMPTHLSSGISLSFCLSTAPTLTRR